MNELLRPKWRAAMAWAHGDRVVRLERSGDLHWRVRENGFVRAEMKGDAIVKFAIEEFHRAIKHPFRIDSITITGMVSS